jgi:AraC-like DNA-binding protein
MFNFLEQIQADPVYYRQLRYDEQLVTEYNCPLDRPKQDLWSHENYVVYVLEGRKGWRHAEGELILGPGDAAFVRKGASIVDQYLEQPFCVVMFFFTDAFICDTLRQMGAERQRTGAVPPPVLSLRTGPVLHGFFHGMLPHFREAVPVRPELLQLKFRELLLSLLNEPHNAELLAYFCSLLNDPVHERMRRVMEDNYCFNLELEDYARLCGRSLSAFKRDFQQVFAEAPGKWLRLRRLERARGLLAEGTLQVSEVAFQCGFENLSHFSRVFKQTYGYSPAGERKATVR